MVAVGFANFIDALSWTTNDVTFTLGQAFDLVPPVLFLHLFLAFPTGRLSGPVERAFVVSAYGAAVVLQAIRLPSSAVWPQQPPRADRARGRRADFAPRGALDDERLLPDPGTTLLLRRRGTMRPLRPMFVLLLDAFALGLVMIAAPGVRFFRRTRCSGDPVGDVRDARRRAARVPRSAAERSARKVGRG